MPGHLKRLGVSVWRCSKSVKHAFGHSGCPAGESGSSSDLLAPIVSTSELPSKSDGPIGRLPQSRSPPPPASAFAFSFSSVHVFLAKYDPEADSLAIRVYREVLERRSLPTRRILERPFVFLKRIFAELWEQEKKVIKDLIVELSGLSLCDLILDSFIQLCRIFRH
jgi:hypothetical protein